MEIEILVVPNCPNEKPVNEHLRRALDDAGPNGATFQGGSLRVRTFESTRRGRAGTLEEDSVHLAVRHERCEVGVEFAAFVPCRAANGEAVPEVRGLGEMAARIDVLTRAAMTYW
ncbi:hypothetical protein ACFU8Q_38350 [Streptomyces sp. NPDC057543]|uniref:hypothetical protein n=1 Tax=Streptomyces sp. NPDC057543 TaxID=3346163 RepID=UPI003683DF94